MHFILLFFLLSLVAKHSPSVLDAFSFPSFLDQTYQTYPFRSLHKESLEWVVWWSPKGRPTSPSTQLGNVTLFIKRVFVDEECEVRCDCPHLSGSYTNKGLDMRRAGGLEPKGKAEINGCSDRGGDLGALSSS